MLTDWFDATTHQYDTKLKIDVSTTYSETSKCRKSEHLRYCRDASTRHDKNNLRLTKSNQIIKMYKSEMKVVLRCINFYIFVILMSWYVLKT